MIRYYNEDIDMPLLDTGKIARWLPRVAALHDKTLGDINYIFCSDRKILEVNRQYLGHDYYTDIITFDETKEPCIAGDLFISLETVASNAEMMQTEFDEELHRVLVHGVLHLCGLKDKQEDQAARMRQEERKALDLLETISSDNRK